MADGPSELRSRDTLEGKKKKKRKSSKNNASWLLKSMQSAYDSLFDTQGQAGSLAETIEKQAAAQKRAAAKKAMESGLTANPYQSLQDQLFNSINSIQPQLTPLETLQKMAQPQVDSQFDPQITALGDEMTAKNKRGKASMKSAREMYGGMAQDFLAQLPEMTQQFAADDAATNARYDQAQSQMQGEYKKQAAEQDAILKRLGVQAAAPEASQQAKDDQAYFQNQMEMDQQAARTAQDEMQSGDLAYQRSLGNNARMAGENTAQDIGAMLEDYLTQAGGQLRGLRAQKDTALSALIAQMQAQDQQNAQQMRQQEIDNMMKMFNFQLDAQKAMSRSGTDANASAPFNQATTGLSGASNFLAQQYPDQPILASNIMEQINDVLANKDVTRGKFVIDPGNESLGRAPKYSDVGQEYMIDLLRQEFAKEGDRYSTGDINSAIDALLAYMGKLR
jgi:hypothetical protein